MKGVLFPCHAWYGALDLCGTYKNYFIGKERWEMYCKNNVCSIHILILKRRIKRPPVLICFLFYTASKWCVWYLQCVGSRCYKKVSCEILHFTITKFYILNWRVPAKFSRAKIWFNSPLKSRCSEFQLFSN